MIDLNGEPIQIVISHNKKTIWINNAECCILRASNIPLTIIEDRSEE